VALFVIVTIPSDPTAMTVNLMAPVVVDVRTRTSRQLVLEDGRSDPSYRVCAPRAAAQAET
jgi:flagellar assembly factor FliW